MISQLLNRAQLQQEFNAAVVEANHSLPHGYSQLGYNIETRGKSMRSIHGIFMRQPGRRTDVVTEMV